MKFEDGRNTVPLNYAVGTKMEITLDLHLAALNCLPPVESHNWGSFTNAKGAYFYGSSFVASSPF